MQYFEALGLDPKLSIDPDDLKKHFYERSRQWHPDKFSRSSAEDQQKALDMTALLNDAFRTLRDPFARAEYYFKEAGIEIPKDLSPAMLEEFFDLNMLVQEMKAGDESVRPQLIQAQQLQSKVREEFSRQLIEFFALYDGYDAASREITKLEEPIGDLLNARRYTDNFLREVEKVLNVHVSD